MRPASFSTLKYVLLKAAKHEMPKQAFELTAHSFHFSLENGDEQIEKKNEEDEQIEDIDRQGHVGSDLVRTVSVRINVC